jgi:Arm domain-containing DNA-binding protein
MPQNVLSDRQIKTATRPGKLFDGGGLHLRIDDKGSKYWRLKFRLRGEERLASFGKYPEVSLAKAREEALKARELIRDGIDPVVERKSRNHTINGTETFQAIATEWIASQSARWRPRYREGLENAKKSLSPHRSPSHQVDYQVEHA